MSNPKGQQYAQQSASQQTDSALYESGSLGDTMRTGMLNELLRKQISPDLPANQGENPENPKVDKTNNLLSCSVEVVDELLNNPVFERASVHGKLSQLFYQQKAIYQQTAIDDELRKRQFISHCGLVMSPDNCITTQLDDIRVRAFIRGIDAALKEKVLTQHDPVHVVYPACGPFAPLLMPLIAYYMERDVFSPEQLQITLIDMQPGAVQSLGALVNQMGISPYIKQICCMDATLYQPPEQQNFDLVVLEAMQHGLSREGHLGIARHFAKLLSPKGSFVPQKIIVTAMLNSAQQEFVEQWRDATSLSEKDMDQQIKSQRILLGNILTVTAQSLSRLPEVTLDENTTLLECGTVYIPELSANNEQTVLLGTRINTWGEEWIGEYDSGISHPLPEQNICVNFTPRETRPGDLLVKSGDGIKFYYRLNGLPGFLPTWTEGEKQDG